MSLEVCDLPALLTLTCAGEAGALQRCAADFSQAAQKGFFSTFPLAAAILLLYTPGLARSEQWDVRVQWGKTGQVENLPLHQPGGRDC